MVSRSRVFAIAGFISSGLALGFLIASFASPYWVEATDGISPSGFKRMGLWEACFNNYYPQNRPAVSKRYQGCFAAISYEMRAIYEYFYPQWMRGVQGMMTLAMLLMLACVLLNIFYFIHCCRGPMERYLVLGAAVIAFIAALFVFVSGTLFGVHVDTDRYWLPHPDSIYLSWAFGLGILGGIFSLVCGMCLITDFIRIKTEDEPYDSHRTEARYAAPPPKYDVAVISKKPAPAPAAANAAPASSFHHNSGYSPPHPEDARKVNTNIVNTSRSANTAAPLIHQGGRYSEPDSEPDDAYDGHPNKTRHSSHHRKGDHSSESEPEEKVKEKSYDQHCRSGRPSHHREGHGDPDLEPPPRYEEEESVKSYSKRAPRESRRSTRRSESEPRARDTDEVRSSRDRSAERSARHTASRRSEPRSHSSSQYYDDETRSVDRQSNASSRHSRHNPRYSESRSRDDEGSRSSHHNNSRRREDSSSRSNRRQEESGLYGRRNSGRSGRQNSHRAGSQSHYEDSRHRY